MAQGDVIQEQQTIKQIALHIVRFVTNRVSSSNNQINRKRIKVHAAAVFDEISRDNQCNDQLFVQALNWIKENYPRKYTHIDIPKKWNGGSRIAIPEAYRDEDKMMCQVKTDIQAAIIYPAVDPERKWRSGDFVWVPKNSESVLILLADGCLEIIDMNG